MTSRLFRFCLLPSAFCLLLAGCHNAKVAEPLTDKLGGSDPEAQMEFWHTLATRNLTSNDEAFHGLLLFIDSEDPSTDYAGRVKRMKDKGLLNPDFDQPSHQAIRRGILAQALVRSLKIKGGLFQRLTHDNPRYAVRELMYLDLYPPSSPQQTFSGTEFLGIIGRIEDYQRGNATDIPAAQLPGENAAAAPGDLANPESRATSRPAAPTVQPTTGPTPRPPLTPAGPDSAKQIP
jgi:hypothetical protein